MAREYSARLGQYDIGRWEYREAQAMARRYPCLMRKMRVLSGRRMGGINGEDYAAMRWETEIVRRALVDTAGGQWAAALEESCCNGVAYADIDPAIMPTSNRNDFFAARREFYWQLWTARQKWISNATKFDTHGEMPV